MTSSLHRRSVCAALALCAALLAGACTPSAPSSGPRPQAEAATRLGPADWNAQSPAAEIATWARQGCRRAPGGKDACIERTLVTLIDDAGIAKSMEVLDTLVNADTDVRANAHALAHGLGISAYRSPETLAATFSACPPTQMSGCYHGVIQGYFLALAGQGRTIGRAEMDGLCEPHRASPFLYFQCSHGMGHGLMAVHENHLPMSLQACDVAGDEFIRQSCYGGAFMENIVQVTHPHHTAAGHAGTQGGHGEADGGGHGGHGQQAAGGHAGHAPDSAVNAHAGHGQQAAAPAAGHDAHAGHGQQAAAADAHAGHGAAGGQQAMAMEHGDWQALKRDDWLYPCNAVAEKYQESCYTMQTSAVLYFNYGNVERTAEVCERAPAQFQATCFLSLGRDVTALASQDHGRSIELCGRAGDAADGKGSLWCTLGVVQNLMNLAADPQEGIRFCRAVGSETKGECYRVVGETIATLVQGADARGRSCQAAESGFVAACRRGAGVEPAASGGSE